MKRVYIYRVCIPQLIYIILTSHLILSLRIIFQLSIIISRKKFFLLRIEPYEIHA